MSTFITQLGLNLFDRAHRDWRAGRPYKDDAILAWEIMHWDSLGLGDLMPNPLDDDPVWPGPYGPLVHGHIQSKINAVNAGILSQLIISTGDPNPQPNLPSPITDVTMRLEGALKLQARLETAMGKLKKTIDRINTQS